MGEDAEALRQEIAELRSRLERNERLLDQVIGVLAVTSGATDALRNAVGRHYSPKSDGDAYAAGMNLRGIFSVMQGAMYNLRQVVEKTKND